MRANERALSEIPNLIRCEQFDREAMAEQLTELTHTVYPHEPVYGDFCTVQAYIECPAQRLFEYMSNPYSLLEWTYSVRRLRPSLKPDMLEGVDAAQTPIFVKAVGCREALTIDYQCAWDQGDELWMIYLNRIVPAEPVLKRPGSVVIWTFVTNQPNPIFLRNWREALELPREKHHDTFDTYGNRFGAALPINLEDALEHGLLAKRGLLALAGFSHAGDYSAAAIIDWANPSQ